jgi:hypothetical protein
MPFVVQGQAFVANEAPAVITASDVVTTFGAHCFDSTVRTLFEDNVLILLVTLTDGTEEHLGLENEDLIFPIGALFLHTDHLDPFKHSWLVGNLTHPQGASRAGTVDMVLVQTGEIVGAPMCPLLLDVNLQRVL